MAHAYQPHRSRTHSQSDEEFHACQSSRPPTPHSPYPAIPTAVRCSRWQSRVRHSPDVGSVDSCCGWWKERERMRKQLRGVVSFLIKSNVTHKSSCTQKGALTHSSHSQSREEWEVEHQILYDAIIQLTCGNSVSFLLIPMRAAFPLFHFPSFSIFSFSLPKFNNVSWLRLRPPAIS